MKTSLEQINILSELMLNARPVAVGILLSSCLALTSVVARAETQPSQELQYFAGNWHCDGVFPANGRKISSTLTFTWYAQTGSALKQHDDLPPNGYHAVELWAASTGGFQNMIADAFGGVRFFSSPGWSNDTLIWASSDQQHQEQFVYTKIDANSMRVDWLVSKNGAPFVIGDTLTCSRTKV